MITIGPDQPQVQIDAGLQEIPTVVYLYFFQPTRLPDSDVLIEWETAIEMDTVGFNILRSPALDGTSERINPDLIPSQAPGSMMGSFYQFTDPSAAPDQTYYYWLELIQICHASTYGPEVVEPIQAQMIYLPILSK